MFPVFLLLACGAPALATPLPVVLNEVYYDAPGADGGAQFVELFNRSFQPVSLTGWRLEAGDGAGENRWRTLWTGRAEDVIPPRRAFTIGEGNVLPRPDRVQIVDLENGPDAVRLTSPAGAQDVVGYGALTYASYFEGRPAEDVPAGSSLARAIDGGDTDDNAADFLALSPPTPGLANRPERDLALVNALPDAERLEPGDAVTLRARLVNRGASALAAHEIEVLLCAAARRPRPARAPTRRAGRLAGGAARRAGRPRSPRFARRRARVHAARAGRVGRHAAGAHARRRRRGERPRAGTTQVGPGALIVHEVLSAPSGGGPWVELRNVSNEPVVLADWTLEDGPATGRRSRRPGFA